MSLKRFAAVLDLGSNSFRLEISRWTEAGAGLSVESVAYHKESVRLGSALSVQKELSLEGIERGLACLREFARVMGAYQLSRVRAVATQTLREAVNAQDFLLPAKEILGCPVEVISGQEEARLIYSGVTHYLPDELEKRLVVDIGGRSTEVILGCGKTPLSTESYCVGCVSFSLKYFSQARVCVDDFTQAGAAAKSVFNAGGAVIDRNQWEIGYGSSGTVGSLESVLRSNGMGNTITRQGLYWLRDQFIAAPSVAQLQLKGLKENRKTVIFGGLAIMIAVFELFDIDFLACSRGALRDGVLLELVQ